jgi:hypothetical protein
VPRVLAAGRWSRAHRALRRDGSLPRAALTGFLFSLPQYEEALEAQAAVLAEYGIDPASISIWDYIDRGYVIQQVAGLAQELGSITFDASSSSSRSGSSSSKRPAYGLPRAHLGPDNPHLRHISQSGRFLIDYVVIRTKVNLITGVGTGLFLALIGATSRCSGASSPSS